MSINAALSVFYGDISVQVTVTVSVPKHFLWCHQCFMVSSVSYGDAEVSVNAVLSMFNGDIDVSSHCQHSSMI